LRKKMVAAKKDTILLGHGSGGRLMHALIKEELLANFDNPFLRQLSDGVVLPFKEPIAFTTDSFVVSPLKFPGGDIGKLAVCGTINDLAVSGAHPLYLSCALIIEEGFPRVLFNEVIRSLALEAKKAGVCVVTGDCKVVQRGACDQLFINTAGIGTVITHKPLAIKNISPGDRIIINGAIAQHGLAVLATRKGLDLGFTIQSDCASLHTLIEPLINTIDIRFMRDPTRGGLASTLNEIAEASGLALFIDEEKIPISSKVKVACELLGIDPLYVANEGKVIMIVKEDDAKKALGLLKKHPLGEDARSIGTVKNSPKAKVIVTTAIGTQRIVDMLTSEPLPRIC